MTKQLFHYYYHSIARGFQLRDRLQALTVVGNKNSPAIIENSLSLGSPNYCSLSGTIKRSLLYLHSCDLQFMAFLAIKEENRYRFAV